MVLTPIFLLMFFNDKEWTRKVWFYAYVLYGLLNAVYAYMIANEKINDPDDGALKEACTKMKNDGHSWDAIGVKNMEECMDHLRGYAMGGFWAFFILGLLLGVHFAWVVYTHWQNATKPKEEGGCEDAHERLE